MTTDAAQTPSRAPQRRSEQLRAELVDAFELGTHELVVLDEACRTLDTCDALADVIDAEGLLVAGNGGVPKMHPAVVELRHQRTTLARLLVALRVPTDEQVGDGGRTQRRAIRGVHVG